MANRQLYLHETIDIIGQGQYDYMAHAVKEPTNVMPDMLTLQGTFFVCAMGGGRWPQVVNIWDVGARGWEGWAANVDRLNLKRRNAFYGDWWDEASKWRSGGFDRLCGAVPGSPSTERIAEQGITGTLFVHQLLEVKPGSGIDYLASVVAEQVPAWRHYDHEPTGIYEVLGNQHEVVVVWATSISGQTRLRAARDAAMGLDDAADPDDALVRWEQLASQFVVGGDTHLMTPLPGTVYGPTEWDEATLDQWL